MAETAVGWTTSPTLWVLVGLLVLLCAVAGAIWIGVLILLALFVAWALVSPVAWFLWALRLGVATVGPVLVVWHLISITREPKWERLGVPKKEPNTQRRSKPEVIDIV